MSEPTDKELIDKLIAETEGPILTVDMNEPEPPSDGRFDCLYMNNQGAVVVTLGDGKTGFQTMHTKELDAACLAMVRFKDYHQHDDVTVEDHATATLPFLRLDFENERALDSMIACLQRVKDRWVEKKLAKLTADMFEAELAKQIDAEKCPHDPTQTTGPIGMYHCPDCGEMVIAGCAHP